MSAQKRTKQKKPTSPSSGNQTEASNRSAAGGFRFPTQRIPLIVLFLVITLGGSSLVLMRGGRSDIKEYTYEIVNEYKHDSTAFTQGLYFDGKYLYESTGSPRTLGDVPLSTIRITDLEGNIIKKRELDAKHFGEGLAKVNNRLIQLTYKSRVALVYDLELNLVEEIPYDWEEGWGLTYDGRHLIVSDGTAKLRFVDPSTFKTVREVTVRSGNRPLYQINELEYINNRIYANVWHDDSIYVIEPAHGFVEARINLSGLYPRNQRSHREAVLNGIAVHSENKTLLVTGKLWPKLFEIRLVEKR
ncbi:MAG TPA: glutaminyl-peptide cyclotransferase [Pirellulaceae bacterium]|nr:glutaminyl-peptide cyclotransferase [Pirellulaceae bacterium]HMO91859.1 glutaminyl-peptide cyclotransferase [Pirellulaceae bacterium]HMP69731.1 glutaminyl-peptide cyclotransferase [Pirellulaceae bacterium]